MKRGASREASNSNMKFTLPTKQLLAALATLKPIAKPNTTHVILSNVCITSAKDAITLLATDMEKQITITLPAKVSESGSTTIPISKLHDSLAKMRNESCDVESNDAQQCTVRAGRDVAKFLGLPSDEMPQPVKIGEGEPLHISAKSFNTALECCLRSAHTAPEEPVLSSVMIVSRAGFLNFQSTNRKLAIVCPSEIPFEDDDFFVIPRDSIPAMMKLSTEGELELLLGKDALSVKSDNIEFRTKLIESDRVPDFMVVFNQEKSGSITCNRNDLVGMIELAEVQVSEQAEHIVLECDGKTLSIRGAKNANATKGEFDMNESDTKVKKGSMSIEVKLHPGYLRDALKSLSGEDAKLEIADNMKPIVIQEKEVRCSICPMKL